MGRNNVVRTIGSCPLARSRVSGVAKDLSLVRKEDGRNGQHHHWAVGDEEAASATERNRVTDGRGDAPKDENETFQTIELPYHTRSEIALICDLLSE